MLTGLSSQPLPSEPYLGRPQRSSANCSAIPFKCSCAAAVGIDVPLSVSPGKTAPVGLAGPGAAVPGQSSKEAKLPPAAVALLKGTLSQGCGAGLGLGALGHCHLWDIPEGGSAAPASPGAQGDRQERAVRGGIRSSGLGGWERWCPQDSPGCTALAYFPYAGAR